MPPLSSHIKRWITAIVAVPALFAVILIDSQILFASVILVAVLIGMGEYHRMAFGEGFPWEKREGMAIALLMVLAAVVGNASLVLPVLTLSVLAVFILHLPRLREETFDVGPVMRLAFGLLYIPLMMIHFIWLRQAPEGVLWIFFVLVLAFSGDVAAYYVGRTFGREKLMPLVSPGKTVAGTWGLFAGSVIGCVVFQHFFFPALPVVHAALMAFVGSVLGQLGDLCESALKRAAGLKDSGTLLPGHGGIMDRLDCLLFIAPFVYYYQLFVIH